MENKGKSLRIISIICVLTLVVLTILPGCNFIGQTKKHDGAVAPVVDDMGNQLCCPICQSTDITDDGNGTYTCNACGNQWKYDQTANQIDVIDESGNTIQTMDVNAGYVSGGSSGGSSSGSFNYGGSSGSSSSGGNGTGGSTGGSNSGGSNGGSNIVTTTKKSIDYKKLAQDIKASMKNFSEAIDIYYDPVTGDITTQNPEGKDRGFFGFKYNTKDQVFITAEDAWQRNFGFEETYDNFAGAGAISYDTIRVKFNYQGNEWMIQFWKGQYGLVLIGAEIGLYNRKENATASSYYDCVTDEEKLNMSMKVYRQNADNQNEYDLLFKRSPTKTWWLTGFTPGTLSAGSYVVKEDATKKLMLQATINFDTPEQAQAFIGGLENTTTILHNSPRRNRSVKFTQVSAAEFESSAKTSKYALHENGKTVYVSWR